MSETKFNSSELKIPRSEMIFEKIYESKWLDVIKPRHLCRSTLASRPIRNLAEAMAFLLDNAYSSGLNSWVSSLNLS